MKSSKNALTQGRGKQEGEQGTVASEFAPISADFHVPNSAHSSLSHLDAFFDTPSVIFPSLLAKIGSNETKRVEADAAQILTSIASSYSGSYVVPTVPLVKRPVGRPRIHPKKELDPNRVKRGDEKHDLLHI